jgi:hypothetical protein
MCDQKQLDVDKEHIREYERKLSDNAWELGFERNELISVSMQNESFFHEWRDDLPYFRNVWNEGRRISA